MSDTYTISFHQKPNAAHRGHNIRAAAAVKYQDHIDSSLIGQNITFKDQTLKDSYDEIFEPAFQEYRSASARPDRIRKSYYDTVANDSRLNLCYEAIVQIGDRNTIGYRTVFDQEELNAFRKMKHGEEVSEEIKDRVNKVLDAQKAVKACRLFVSTWEERNPGMHLFGAYLHADESEGTIHMHLDYIPVVDKQKRGTSVQTSLDRCCKKIVDSRYDSATAEEKKNRKRGGQKSAENMWQNLQREDLQMLARQVGLELDWTKESPTPRQHMETAEYKKYRDEINGLQAEKDELQKSIEKYAAREAKAKLQMSDLYDQLHEVQGQLATGNLRRAEAAVKLGELNQELDMIRQTISQSQHQVEEKTRSLKQMEIEIESLRKEKDILSEQLDESRKIISSMEVSRDEAKKIVDQYRELTPLTKKETGYVKIPTEDFEKIANRAVSKTESDQLNAAERKEYERVNEKNREIVARKQEINEEKELELQNIREKSADIDQKQANLDSVIRDKAEQIVEEEYMPEIRQMKSDASNHLKEAEQAHKEAERAKKAAKAEQMKYQEMNSNLTQLIQQRAEELIFQAKQALEMEKEKYRRLSEKLEKTIERQKETFIEKVDEAASKLLDGFRSLYRFQNYDKNEKTYRYLKETDQLEEFEDWQTQDLIREQRERDEQSWDDWEH